VRLLKPRNRAQWGMGPLTVNAYYSAADNKFVMPIGILQPPFFDPKESDEVNLGSIGAVIGHELGHGIDDKGSRFDADGRLNSWMSPTDLAEFNRRGEKLVEQFGRIGYNGKLTLGENIGDLVGLSFAYQSAFGDGKGTIPAKKAFFLQYARAWCTVIRPKFRETLLKTDPHSMGDARVNEQMKHQGGFAEAYSCKASDRLFLNPQDRVKIW
jgi:putative endopeptidase